MVNYFIKKGADRDGKEFFQLVRQEPKVPDFVLARKYRKKATVDAARTKMIKERGGAGKGNRRGKKQAPQYESL
tara:strand:+ start:1035 stop:1256 length:222 start_codon:yes stop_codon:yes gene_type:complete